VLKDDKIVSFKSPNERLSYGSEFKKAVSL